MLQRWRQIPASSPYSYTEIVKMKPRRSSAMIGMFSFVIIMSIISFWQHGEVNDVLMMRKKTSDWTIDDTSSDTGTLEFKGITKSEWCVAPKYPPLDFENCKFNDFLFRFPLIGGLTNGLHFVLKGAMWAYEENVCYFVDEKGPNPASVADRELPLQKIDPFLERYFEPVSLPREHEKVQWAMKKHKFIEPDYFQIAYHTFGKHNGGLRLVDDPLRHELKNIESLSIYEKDNIWTKKWMLRRLFRLLPHIRNVACSKLSALGLEEEFIALSVRRGDKELEYELESSLQPYIDKAEIAVESHFGGKVPMIFVASDDCSVMGDIRKLRPQWVFVGECDNASEENGFILSSMKKWTETQTDQHFEKFITEMIAMASAKYFIGVSTTNVSFWIYFMRHMEAEDDTWTFVDTDLYPF